MAEGRCFTSNILGHIRPSMQPCLNVASCFDVRLVRVSSRKTVEESPRFIDGSARSRKLAIVHALLGWRQTYVRFDMTTIVEAVTSLKTATDILNSLKNLRGRSGTDKSLEDEITKLQGIIYAAQGSALSAQMAQFSMVQSIRELEERIAEFETWDSEKTRYELVDVNPGRGSVFVYRLRPEAARSEPIHCLCPKCFQHRRPSILQGTPELQKAQRVHVCPECKSSYVFGNQASAPQQNTVRAADFDVFQA
jgi:hypothetical protein